ncbi:hypothetical protein D3C81_1489470 [compost metagenome]
MLTIFDNQIGLHTQITLGPRRRRTQTALVELIGHSLADALFGQVAFDSWIIGAILQGGVFPAPAAIGGKVAAGIEVVVDPVGGAGAEQRGHGQ